MDIIHTTLLATEQAAETSGGVVGTLGINWKLFLAQLVNFGIVLFVLWKWVFKPVAGALESRRQKIEESVQKAAEIEKARLECEIEREAELKKARALAEQLLNKALAQAASLKQETISASRKEAEEMLTEARTAIESEREQLVKEVREELAGLTIMASERILKAKLDSGKDKELVGAVIKNL